jgi:hypothetical protein
MMSMRQSIAFADAEQRKPVLVGGVGRGLR